MDGRKKAGAAEGGLSRALFVCTNRWTVGSGRFVGQRRTCRVTWAGRGGGRGLGGTMTARRGVWERRQPGTATLAGEMIGQDGGGCAHSTASKPTPHAARRTHQSTPRGTDADSSTYLFFCYAMLRYATLRCAALRCPPSRLWSWAIGATNRAPVTAPCDGGEAGQLSGVARSLGRSAARGCS